MPIWEREERERQQFLFQVAPTPGLPRTPPLVRPNPGLERAACSAHGGPRPGGCTSVLPWLVLRPQHPLACGSSAAVLTRASVQAHVSAGSKMPSVPARAGGEDRRRRAASASAAAGGHASEEEAEDTYDIGPRRVSCAMKPQETRAKRERLSLYVLDRH